MIENVLWIQTAFLGDIILTTGSFNLLKKFRPDIKQYLITTPIGKAALEDHPDLNLIIPFDKKKQSMLNSFKKCKSVIRTTGLNKKNTLVLQAHLSSRSSLLAMYLGFPCHTFHESSMSWHAQVRYYKTAVLHESQRIALLLQSLGIERPLVPIPPHLHKTNHSERTNILAKRKNNGETLIGIACGSVWPTKRWPIEHFQNLVEMLLKEHGTTIVLLGSKDETDAANLIYQHSNFKKNIIQLAGATNLKDLRAVIPELDLLISNDSSLVHYASAFSTPTLTIFGPTSSQMGFSPIGNQTVIVENKDLTCRPCSLHGPIKCPLGHFSCMRSISPDLIYQKSRAILAG